MEYIIVKATRDACEKLVTDMLGKGFKLYGPPFASPFPHRDPREYGEELIICQAMTRTRKETEDE